MTTNFHALGRRGRIQIMHFFGFEERGRGRGRSQMKSSQTLFIREQGMTAGDGGRDRDRLKYPHQTLWYLSINHSSFLGFLNSVRVFFFVFVSVNLSLLCVETMNYWASLEEKASTYLFMSHTGIVLKFKRGLRTCKGGKGEENVV